MQYQQWLREWLESYVKPSSKQKTYIRYSEIVEQHRVYIKNPLFNSPFRTMLCLVNALSDSKLYQRI